MVRLAAAAAAFTRDVAFDLDRVRVIVTHAREAGAAVLALPDGALGGYAHDLYLSRPAGRPASGGVGRVEPDALPPALDPYGPEVRAVSAMAGDLVVCIGYCEDGGTGKTDGTDEGGPVRYNAAVCVSGDGVLGRHRKVHQPAGAAGLFRGGEGFTAFDTPAGRMGMLIDHDKTFPEAARVLALDGADLVACLSAWPASLTDRARRMAHDRQARLFDLYDQARAAENQILWLSANQSGRSGSLHFLGRAKVVGPGGEILARTWSKGGLAVADVEPDLMIGSARAVLHHLTERRPNTYREPAGPAHPTEPAEPAEPVGPARPGRP